jgi:hypothetical protein
MASTCVHAERVYCIYVGARVWALTLQAMLWTPVL